jgi:hypothetical protein
MILNLRNLQRIFFIAVPASAVVASIGSLITFGLNKNILIACTVWLAASAYFGWFLLRRSRGLPASFITMSIGMDNGDRYMDPVSDWASLGIAIFWVVASLSMPFFWKA